MAGDEREAADLSVELGPSGRLRAVLKIVAGVAVVVAVTIAIGVVTGGRSPNLLFIAIQLAAGLAPQVVVSLRTTVQVDHGGIRIVGGPRIARGAWAWEDLIEICLTRQPGVWTLGVRPRGSVWDQPGPDRPGAGAATDERPGHPRAGAAGPSFVVQRARRALQREPCRSRVCTTRKSAAHGLTAAIRIAARPTRRGRCGHGSGRPPAGSFRAMQLGKQTAQALRRVARRLDPPPAKPTPRPVSAADVVSPPEAASLRTRKPPGVDVLRRPPPLLRHQ